MALSKKLSKELKTHINGFVLKLWADGDLSEDFTIPKHKLRIKFGHFNRSHNNPIDSQNITIALLKCNFLVRTKNNEKNLPYYKFKSEKINRLRDEGQFRGLGNMSTCSTLSLDTLDDLDSITDDSDEIPFMVQHVITFNRKINSDFQITTKCCIVCHEIFKLENDFQNHLKMHGDQFVIKRTGRNVIPNNFKMVVAIDIEEGEFNFNFRNITKDTLTVLRVLLISPSNNMCFLQNERWPLSVTSGSSGEFSVDCERFPAIKQPYSIILHCQTHMDIMEQHHFIIKEELKLSSIGLQKIESAGKNRSRMGNQLKLTKLDMYYPNLEMKELFSKNFKDDLKLSIKSRNLLKAIEIYEKIDNNIRLNPQNYIHFLSTLLQIEDLSAEKELSSFDKFDQKLTWRNGYYILVVPNLSEHRPTLVDGDQLWLLPMDLINSNTKSDRIYGSILRVERDHIVIQAVNLESLNLEKSYKVHFLANRMTIRLERRALEIMERERLCNFMFPAMPTSAIEFDIITDWFNSNIETNPEQTKAVKCIIAGSAYPAPYILFGPPGTGKTMTIVEAICQLWKIKSSSRILVTASSNAACNEITMRLLEYITSTDIYRMFAAGKEREIDSIDDDLLDISNLDSGCHYYPPLEELYKFRIIVTTLTIAGKLSQAISINTSHFTHVFIDECGSSTETSALIAIAGIITCRNQIKGNIILAGDPKQLGPVLCSEKAINLGLEKSLLERLMDRGIYAKDPSTNKYKERLITKLVRNYRSHPKILEFSNEAFYDNHLQPKADKAITDFATNWHLLPCKNIPIIFESVAGSCRQDQNSPSWYNMREVDLVIFYLKEILFNGIKDNKITQKDIGIISPYKKQCIKIKNECQKHNWNDIEIGSVETFQGQEKLIIILSTVRSNMNSVGFLSNPRRLNVALTRAKALMIIIGNATTLQIDPNWRKFIEFCVDNQVVNGITFELLRNKEILNHVTKTNNNLYSTINKPLNNSEKLMVKNNDSAELIQKLRSKLSDKNCNNVISYAEQRDTPLNVVPNPSSIDLLREKSSFEENRSRAKTILYPAIPSNLDNFFINNQLQQVKPENVPSTYSCSHKTIVTLCQTQSVGNFQILPSSSKTENSRVTGLYASGVAINQKSFSVPSSQQYVNASLTTRPIYTARADPSIELTPRPAPGTKDSDKKKKCCIS